MHQPKKKKTVAELCWINSEVICAQLLKVYLSLDFQGRAPLFLLGILFWMSKYIMLLRQSVGLFGRVSALWGQFKRYFGQIDRASGS